MIEGQFSGNRKYRIGHGKQRPAQNSPPNREPAQDFQFVTMLTMNDHRDTGEPGCANRFERSKIARVCNVRAKFLHDAHKPEQGELEAHLGARCTVGPNSHIHAVYKRCVHAAISADAMFELLVNQARQELKHSMLGPAQT